MGYPVCPNRIHSSGINGPRKSLFEITKSFLGDGHRLKLFLGVWESGALAIYHFLCDLKENSFFTTAICSYLCPVDLHFDWGREICCF